MVRSAFRMLLIGLAGGLLAGLLPVLPGWAQAGAPATVAHQLNERAVAAFGSKPQRALALARRAGELARTHHEPGEEARAWGNTGSAYYVLEQYEQALSAYGQALKLHERNRDVHGQAATLNNIGNVYYAANRLTPARRYYERSLLLDRQQGDSLGVADSYVNLANVLADDRRFAQALVYSQRALAGFQAAHDRAKETSALNNIASLLTDQGRFAEARPYLDKCLRMNQELGNKYGEAVNLQSLGDICQRQQQWEPAAAYFRQSLQVGAAFSGTVRDNLLRLATVQERAGRHAAAYGNYQRYNALKDSIFTKETATRLTEVETRYRTQQQQRQLQKQQLLLRAQRTDLGHKNQLLGFGLASAVLLLLGAGALARLVRQRSRTNRLLATTHAEIRQTAAQRELLVQEIHERVKSNLQMVSNLLEWQPTDTPDAPIVRAAMAESQARIQAMALVHENLHQTDQQAQIRLDIYLGQLIEALHAAHTAAHCPVRLTTHLAPLVLGAQEAVPFGLMVNEILTNAYKHAFRGRTAGHLHVSLEMGAVPAPLAAPGTGGPGPAFRLIVADDGVGLPAPAAAAGAPVRPPSLGMQLVRLLTRQLRATLNTSAGAAGGARFEVRRGVWGLLALLLPALLLTARPGPAAAQADPPAGVAAAEPPMSRAQQIDKRAEDALAINPKLALRLAHQAEAVAVAEHDTVERAWAVTNIGSAYFVLERYAPALNAYWRALNLHEANHDPDGQAACLNDLGNLCLSHQQFDAAMRYYGRSLRLYRQLGDSLGVASLYVNLSTAESGRHQPEVSLRDARRALAMLRGAHEPDDEVKALNNIGTTLLQLNRPAEAVPYLVEALRITHHLDDRNGRATTLKSLGNAHRALRRWGSAIAYYNEALQVGQPFGSVVRSTHRQLAELYAQTGDYAAANVSYRQYIALNDSLYQRDVANRVVELETRYRTRQQRRQLEIQALTLGIQRVTIARKNQQTQLAFGLVALLLISAGGLTYQVRRRTQANRRLTAATEEVRQAVAQKEILIQEIHHRVKNNLQMVSSLLKWQADATPALQAAVETSQARIQALALLHEHLYRGDDLTQVRLDAYLNQLLLTLREAHDQTPADPLRLTTELAPISLNLQEASDFAVLISEIFTTALHHAYRTRSRGHLYVALAARGVGGFHLRVSVNGVQLPTFGDPAPAALAWSAALDHQLVQTFSRQLGATLHYAATGQTGIHIELTRAPAGSAEMP